MTAILPILPEILLLVLGVLILIIDPFLRRDASRCPKSRRRGSSGQS